MLAQGADLIKLPNGNLKVVLTDEGREIILDVVDRGDSEAVIMWELLETVICNSDWEILNPGDIALAPDSLILSDEVERNEVGDISRLGRVYWHANHGVELAHEALLERGELILTGVN